MIAKLFEVRDVGTFIPVLAVQMGPGGGRDRYLLDRAGFGATESAQERSVTLIQINGGSGAAYCDPYDWGGARTMVVAHDYILRHFDALESGAVVDVEHILGETTAPKAAEALA